MKFLICIDFAYTPYIDCNATDWLEYKSNNYIDHYFMWNIWTRTHGFQLFMVYSYESSPINMTIETSNVELDVIDVETYGAVVTVTNFPEFVYYRYKNVNGTSMQIFTSYVDIFVKQVF